VQATSSIDGHVIGITSPNSLPLGTTVHGVVSGATYTTTITGGLTSWIVIFGDGPEAMDGSIVEVMYWDAALSSVDLETAAAELYTKWFGTIT
jgi:hypothetical protein